MKLAIVCDDLIQKGGAERIVEEFPTCFLILLYTQVLASKEWIRKFLKEK
jgi:hypothetical protein